MTKKLNEETLQAYFDGELGWLARKRVERVLAASPEAREDLEGLSLVGEWVRESQSAGPEPDLWAEIARELPRGPVVEAEAGGGFAEALGWIFRPAGAAVAAAAAAAVGIFVLSGSEPAGLADVVQYLDPGENSVMLLQGEDEATIIWVMEPAATETDTSSRNTRAFI